MKRTSWSSGLAISGDGSGVVAHAGSVAVRLLADRVGLTEMLSTALVRRGFVPGHDRGRVLVDGVDLVMADTTSLRRQIGVVLQENMLFNRSIRENIALTDPGLPIEAVMQAAKLAGAHEFILELPEGYDTAVGEHGATLSGGQRQRIAIARALISNPRILIFDEATSALDYESERIIQNNMKAICQGRTVLIIAHRLSAVRDANRIIVMDRGQIVEQGAVIEVFTNPQHATTRSLIDEILPQELPASVITRIRKLMATEPHKQGSLLRLAFAGEDSNQPLLSDISRRFGLDLNILHGQVDDIQGQMFGSLALHARGDTHQLAAAVAHLRGAGVLVTEEELSHV